MKGLKNRVGRFEISMELIEKAPQDVMAVMQNVIIVRAESMFIKDAITYDAYSPLFETVEDCSEVPTYEFVVHRSIPFGNLKEVKAIKVSN